MAERLPIATIRHATMRAEITVEIHRRMRRGGVHQEKRRKVAIL